MHLHIYSMLWLVIAAPVCVAVSGVERAELLKEIEMTPPLPDFSKYFEAIPALGRKLRCSSPCIGIHGCGHALNFMQVPTHSNNVFDLDERYRECLHQHMLDAGMVPVEIILNLGKRLGDLLRRGLQHLELPVDILVCGPPCPPWAGQGCHNSFKDARAKVFCRIIEWIVFLAHCGGLLCVLVENVIGVTHMHMGMEPPMDKFLRILRTHVPFFSWSVDTLCAVSYMCPQTRVRTFLRGMRTSVVYPVPRPLEAFGQRRMREALGKFPCTPRSHWTPQQQLNLRCYEELIISACQEDRLLMDDIVVVAADRQQGLTYLQQMTVNNAPTFTTGNKELCIISVRDVVENVPDHAREFFRRFKETERLTFMGFPPELVLTLGRQLTWKATGNAYPPPLIVAGLQPLIMALARSTSFQFFSWPPVGTISHVVPDNIMRLARSMLNSRGMIADKAKYAEAKAKAKRMASRKRSVISDSDSS
jgi:site-specific DNA-cytosine methylase